MGGTENDWSLIDEGLERTVDSRVFWYNILIVTSR